MGPILPPWPKRTEATTLPKISWMGRRCRPGQADAPLLPTPGVPRVVKAIFFVLLATAGARFGLRAWQVLVRHPSLALRQIEVSGHSRVSRQHVLAYAGASLGVPVLGLDLDAMTLRLRQHPFIAVASVRRVLPDRLQIDVVEHKPRVLVSLGELYLADAQGQLFKRYAGHDGINLPVVTGLARDDAVHALPHLPQRLRQAALLADEVEQLPQLQRRLEEMHWDDATGWSIVLMSVLPPLPSEPSGPAVREPVPGQSCQVHLGPNPLQQMDRVAQVLHLLAARGDQAQVLWADGHHAGLGGLPVKIWPHAPAPASAPKPTRRLGRGMRRAF